MCIIIIVFNKINNSHIVSAWVRFINKMSTRKWVVKNAFQGMPKREDFEIIEEQLPPLGDGGKLYCCVKFFCS